MMAVPLAKVVLLTKDEPGMVDDFFAHYSALFGAENVVVVDNGSTDPRVLRSYERFRRDGATVKVDGRPFAHALHWMSEHIAALKGTCEWVLPLETDEFIFLPLADADALVTAEAVQDVLRRVPADASVLRYSAFLGSVVDPKDGAYRAPPAEGSQGYSRPAEQMTQFYDQGWDKLIIRVRAFERMTQWCHHAKVREGDEFIAQELGLLHFHATGRARVVERAHAVSAAYGYIEADPPPVRAPLHAQLQRLDAIVGAHVSCGHKAEYCASHLRRRLVLQACRSALCRMPSVHEMQKLLPHAACPARLGAAVRSLPGASPSGACPPLAWEALLYAETDPAPDTPLRTVVQVARTLWHLDASLPRKRGASERGRDHESGTTGAGGDPECGVTGALARVLAQHKHSAQSVLRIAAQSTRPASEELAAFFESAVVYAVDDGRPAASATRAPTHPRVRARRLNGRKEESARTLGVLYDAVLDVAQGEPDGQVASLIAFGPYVSPGGAYVVRCVRPERMGELQRAATLCGLRLDEAGWQQCAPFAEFRRMVA